MTPRNGRDPMGERVEGVAPHDHWRTTTFVVALPHDRLTAPCMFDEPINGPYFRAWTEQAVAPTLQAGDIVILDNLSRQAISAVTGSPASSKPSKAVAPSSSTCRPIAQTLIHRRSADRGRRASLRQARAPPAQSRRSNRRSPKRRHHQPARRVLTDRGPKPAAKRRKSANWSTFTLTGIFPDFYLTQDVIHTSRLC